MSITRNKFFFTILLLFFPAIKIYAHDISYDVYHHEKKLHVIIEFRGSKTGLTNISIPHKIWGHSLNKQIKNFKILSNKCKLNANTLLHPPNQAIKIAYDVINIKTARRDKFYYTTSKKEGFFFLHDFALIYPHAKKPQKVAIRYHSDQKEASGILIGEEASFGLEFVTSLEKIKGGVSIFGNSNILKKSAWGDTFIFCFDINDDNFTILKSTLSKVSAVKKPLCNLKTKNNLYIFIGNNSNHQSYRGTLLEKGPLLLLIPNIIDKFKILHLLSHENLHRWIGSSEFIRFDPKDEEKFKWFFEGFTDYLALKNNLLEKNISLKQYLSMYNRILERNFSSQYSATSYKDLYKKYWSSPNIKQVIYDRGHIIAQEIDTEIQKNSDKSLQDIVCTLARSFHDDKSLTFSKRTLVNSIKENTNYDLEKKLDELIDGNITASKKIGSV